MHIAFFLTPKHEVAYLNDNFTLRQGLEKLLHHRYTAIPVLNQENKYVGTVSEGDFLRYLLKDGFASISAETLQAMEQVTVGEVLLKQAAPNPAVRISQTASDLLQQAMQQNFIPVVDDYDFFIGIVTRKDIMQYVYREGNLFAPPAEQ